MDIIIYSTPGCFYCTQMKELCKRAEVEYKEHVVEQDITMGEFHNLFPHVAGFPHVIIDGKVIGGLVETAKYFINEGLVGANKG